MDEDKVFQEVNVFDLLGEIGSKNKVLNATTLTELEKYIDKGSKEFAALRKFILDEQNSYTRSIVRLIFGDVEYERVNTPKR
jgi:ERCC4-type nuclease